MDIRNKELDKNIKCIICESVIDNDIIIEKRLICNSCFENISNLSVDDFSYDYYKEKIKNWISNKYNID